MAWVVLFVLFGIVFFGGVIFAFADPIMGGSVAMISALVFGIITVAMSLTTVGQREVGIQQSFSGKISDQYKTTGVQWHAPWTHIIKEDIGLLKETFNFSNDNSAVSKDQQQIHAVVTLNYRVTPQDVVALYKTVGPKWREVILDGRIPQDFKETTATFTAPDITLKRPELRTKTLTRLRKELCPKGDSGEFCIKAEDVFISNVEYSKTYNAAIEAKVVQQQAALQAEAKIVQAHAEAEQRIKQAEGEARAIELKGRALRNNPEILRLEAIDKLNPNAQVIFCTGQTCPSIVGNLGR